MDGTHEPGEVVSGWDVVAVVVVMIAFAIGRGGNAGTHRGARIGVPTTWHPKRPTTKPNGPPPPPPPTPGRPLSPVEPDLTVEAPKFVEVGRGRLGKAP